MLCSTLSSGPAETEVLVVTPDSRTGKILDISRKSLSVLPMEVFQHTRLSELNAGYNKLTTFPPEIGQLRALTILDVRCGYSLI